MSLSNKEEVETTCMVQQWRSVWLFRVVYRGRASVCT